MRLKFHQVEFVKSAVAPKGYPTLGDAFPEVAVAGRSNVGKSSLLNNLFNRKNMVKTSSVPGKTQMLNFFNVDSQLLFVDLPGYGYAKTPVDVKKKWGPMVQSYLESRPQLQLILFLMDIRRDPNDDDRRLMDWIIHYEKAAILVITKVDKVGKTDRVKRTKAIIEGFSVEDLHYVHYSATKNIGRHQLITMIGKALEDETS